MDWWGQSLFIGLVFAALYNPIFSISRGRMEKTGEMASALSSCEIFQRIKMLPIVQKCAIM